MNEYKVGEQIVLEVKEDNTRIPYRCSKCFIGKQSNMCVAKCHAVTRKDGKNVIFVEKGK